MQDLRITVVPVGRIDPAEVEGAATRLAKVVNRTLELREPAPVPRASEDVARGQHRAGPMLAELAAGLVKLKAVKLVGGATGAAPSPLAVAVPDAVLFVTDVDLYTPNTDSVFGDLAPRSRAALISVRRLREAFYRRKADPAKQRARVVKTLLHAVGRIRGAADCRDPRCAMAPTVALADIDTKDEKYCAACWKRISTGTLRI